MKLTIEYNPERGKAFTDDYMYGEYKRLVELIKEDAGDITLSYANELMIHHTRMLVIRGVIAPENVKYIFSDGWNKKEIGINEYGRLDDWPKGFCDNTDTIIEELLTTAIKKHKRIKDNANIA